MVAQAGENTAVGVIPADGELDLDGLDLAPDAVEQLFAIDHASWRAECDLTEQYFDQFNGKVPAALLAELASLRYHLKD